MNQPAGEPTNPRINRLKWGVNGKVAFYTWDDLLSYLVQLIRAMRDV